jgi:hypothetical protein
LRVKAGWDDWEYLGSAGFEEEVAEVDKAFLNAANLLARRGCAVSIPGEGPTPPPRN